MIEAMTKFIRGLGDDGVDLANALVRIVLILGVAWLVSWVARRQIEPILTRRSFGRNGALLVGRLVSIAAFASACLAILGSLGASWTGLLAVLSAFTVAVGLSLQDVMKNFFAGIILLVERPFQIGDRVRVKEVEGEVQGIDIRTTLIRNKEGALVLVPNSLMYTEILTNRSHFSTRRLVFSITSTSKPTDEVERLIKDALSDHTSVRKPLPAPYIRSASADGVRMEMSLLVQAIDGVEREIMQILLTSLEDCTIEIQE